MLIVEARWQVCEGHYNALSTTGIKLRNIYNKLKEWILALINKFFQRELVNSLGG